MLKLKLEKLQNLLAALDGILVAFSGGVDSSFLLRVALEVQAEKVVAVTAQSEFFPEHELNNARKMASLLGARHIIISVNPLQNAEIRNNPPERCYLCKKLIFSQLKSMAADLGLAAVVDGANADDCGDYRPGMKASRELGVRSPLLESGLTKAEIRELSAAYQLPTWDMPTYACLATRFPYGTELTVTALKKVEQGENFLKKMGVKQCRLRRHDQLARIEIDPADFQKVLAKHIELVKFLKELGFNYVCLDLEGYQSGSMNQTISN